MTWLQPLWLAYPTAALAILTLLFALSVRWTLKAHPVPVLNYAYEPHYARTYRQPTVAYNFPQAYSMTATSAVAHIHVGFPHMTREQIRQKREIEDRMWGFLPEVGS